MTKSPLPLPANEPVRASPSAPRADRRRSWCVSSGASVARTMMIEPSPVRTGGVGVSNRPTLRRPIAQVIAGAVVAWTNALTVRFGPRRFQPRARRRHCRPCTVAGHPGAAAHRPSGTGATDRAVQRRQHCSSRTWRLLHSINYRRSTGDDWDDPGLVGRRLAAGGTSSRAPRHRRRSMLERVG